jgi:hypothetical protein
MVLATPWKINPRMIVAPDIRSVYISKGEDLQTLGLPNHISLDRKRGVDASKCKRYFVLSKDTIPRFRWKESII